MPLPKFFFKFHPHRISALSIILLSVLAILYSPYFIINLPIFKINTFEINASPEGKKRTKEILRKDFDNSWLLLLLNKEKFDRELEKSSNYSVKGTKIEVLSLLKGKVKIKLIYRKPFALLKDGNNFLSYGGIIFSNSVFKNFIAPKLIIDLKGYDYNIGSSFSAENFLLLKENVKILKAKCVVVDRFNVYYHNDFATIKTPKGRKLGNMQSLLLKLREFRKDILINLEPSKFFLAKINKERCK